MSIETLKKRAETEHHYCKWWMNVPNFSHGSGERWKRFCDWIKDDFRYPAPIEYDTRDGKRKANPTPAMKMQFFQFMAGQCMTGMPVGVGRGRQMELRKIGRLGLYYIIPKHFARRLIFLGNSVSPMLPVEAAQQFLDSYHANAMVNHPELLKHEFLQVNPITNPVDYPWMTQFKYGASKVIGPHCLYGTIPDKVALEMTLNGLIGVYDAPQNENIPLEPREPDFDVGSVRDQLSEAYEQRARVSPAGSDDGVLGGREQASGEDAERGR